MLPMVVVIDLHAAQINQFSARPRRLFELPNGGLSARRKHRPALNVQGVWMQASLVASLGKSNCVKDSSRHLMAFCRAQNFSFTSISGSDSR